MCVYTYFYRYILELTTKPKNRNNETVKSLNRNFRVTVFGENFLNRNYGFTVSGRDTKTVNLRFTVYGEGFLRIKYCVCRHIHIEYIY